MKLISPNSKISLLLFKPQRPTTLDEPPAKSKLGSNYDTGWSRRYGVRLIRAMLLDAVVRPGVEVIASPEIKNQDRIDHLSAPVIFAANHSSHIDTPVMLSTLPAKFRHRCVVGAGADYFFDKRWKAILWSGVLSAIPIERSKPSRRAGELAVDLIKEGWNLLIFPEGGRTPDGLGQQHKTGVAQLAIRTGAPIVPIYLEGTYEILNKTSKRFKPGTVTASYGAPIYASDSDDPRELTKTIQAAIDRLADELHSDFLSAARRSAKGETPPLAPASRGWIEKWNRVSSLSKGRKLDRWPTKLFNR